MRRIIVLFLFLLSGAAGLVYQVAWMRKLHLIMGVTSEAVATVLAVFMGGLALGSWLLGRAGDDTRNPLRFYGWLELGIAVFGFQSVLLLDGLQHAYVDLQQSGAVPDGLFPLVRFLLAGAALIGPTTLMGGTLPVLIKGFCRTPKKIAKASGLLYAVNTLGAAIGTLAAAFFLVQAAGIQNTIFITAGVNLFAGITALWLARQEEPPPLLPEDGGVGEEDGGDRGTARAVVIAFGFSGFLALAYEVLWTRYLIYVVGENSVYAFSMMLAAFLLGLVLGSALAALIGDRVRNLVALFGGVQVLIGAAAFATVALMGYLARSRNFGEFDFYAMSLRRFGKCLAVLIVPATLSGSTFAIVAKIYARRLDRLGRDAGRAYAVNTLGAILGALAGGFVVLPCLKLRYGLITLGAASVLVGWWILLRRPASQGRCVKTAAAATLLAAAGAASIHWAGDPVERALVFGDEVIEFYEDGPEASVAVTRNRESGDLGLIVDGDGQAGTNINLQIHLRLLGHLPALFHPGPREILCVGYGSGITAGCLAQHQVERVDIVELSRAVIRGAELFEPYNHDPLHDPRVRLIRDDGRNFLLATKNLYDVIASDPIDPDDAGVTSLYSREYYELVRSRLREGGVACQWLTVQYDPDEYKMLIRTFTSVFPEVSIWYADFTTILLGVKGGPRVGLEDLRERFAHPPVAKSLEVIGISKPEELLPLCLAGPGPAKAFAGEGSLNTDDRPLIEYLGPRYSREQYADAAEETVWKPLMAARTPNMNGWMARWSEEDQAAVRPYYEAMDRILQVHRLRFDTWGESRLWRDLKPEEADRRFLAGAKTRDERRRKILDLTFDILGSPAARLHLVLAGLGAEAKRERRSRDEERIYEAAMAQAMEAWRNGDLEDARRDFKDALAAVPSDKRAAIMAAACLDRGGELTRALEEMLAIDMTGVDPYAAMRWFAHDLFGLVLREMEREGSDPRALGRFLLDITPEDKDRPSRRDRFRYEAPGGDARPPRPKPGEENAADVQAWRLWLKDAAIDLEGGEGVFNWK